jgi:hypothetical protein
MNLHVRTPLQRLWEGWKRVGKKIGDFQARLILSLFYFICLSAFARELLRAA